MQGQLGWEFLCKRGTAAAKVTTSFGGEKKNHLFPLNAFIPLLKCGGLCLDVGCSYPSTLFWLILDWFFRVFLLVLAGLLFFFFCKWVLQVS